MMERQKDLYERPKLQEVEFDFNEDMCTCWPVTGCVTSEKGSVDIKMNQFGGDLTWHDYDEEVNNNNRRGF